MKNRLKSRRIKFSPHKLQKYQNQLGRAPHPYILFCLVLMLIGFMVLVATNLTLASLKTTLEAAHQRKRIVCEDFSLAIQPTLVNAGRTMAVRHTLGVQNAWNNDLKKKNKDFTKTPTFKDVTDFIVQHYPALYPLTLHGSTIGYTLPEPFKSELGKIQGDALLRIDFNSLRLASQPRAGTLNFVARFTGTIPYTIRYTNKPLAPNREYMTVLGSAWYPTNLPDLTSTKDTKDENGGPGKTPPTRSRKDDSGEKKLGLIDTSRAPSSYYSAVEFEFEVRFAIPLKDDPIVEPPPPVIRPGTPGGAPATTGNCPYTTVCYAKDGSGQCNQWVVQDCNGNPVSAVFDNYDLAQEVAGNLSAGEGIGETLDENPTEWTHMFGSTCDGTGGDPKCQVWVPLDIPVNQEIAAGEYGVDPEAPPGTEPPVDHLGIDENSNLRKLSFFFHPYAAYAPDVRVSIGSPKYKRTSWQ